MKSVMLFFISIIPVRSTKIAEIIHAGKIVHQLVSCEKSVSGYV